MTSTRPWRLTADCWYAIPAQGPTREVFELASLYAAAGAAAAPGTPRKSQ